MTLMDERRACPKPAVTPRRLQLGLVTGKIIERVGPLLGLAPRFEAPKEPFPILARMGYGFCQRAGDRRRRTLMRLAELLGGAGLDPALADLDIAGISADSRAVEHGFAFSRFPASPATA